MTDVIKVKGGNPLIGSVTPVPNKNAILAALPVCILTDETVTYHNVPKSTDVIKMLEMLTLMGASVDDSDFSNLKICCKKMHSYTVDKDLGNLIRSSLMFAGPLLVRFGIAKIPIPGGCVLGKRSIAAHVDSFEKAGVKFDLTDGYAVFTAPKKSNSNYNIWQFEASVTGTENLFLYAAGASSRFEVTDCACEPHVTQLLQLLQSMGAKVEGIGSNRVCITGTKKLKGTEFTPDPDFVDIGGLIVAAAITKGKLTLKGANIPRVVDGMLGWFRRFNIDITEKGSDLVIDGKNELIIDYKNSGFPMAGDNLPKLAPKPWPGFPVDALPPVVTLACKAKGDLLIKNWMYETGLDFIRELNSMGADIFMCDPERIIVHGPVTFKSRKVTAPDIIQACKAIFLASLADPVETTITGWEILKRRYPDVLEVYKKLGAEIQTL